MKQRPNLKQYLRKLFSALAIAGTLLGLPSADAATITVTNNRDSGSGSLRQALADAHNDDAIDFDSSLEGQTITLASGELVVNKIVSINGPGPNNLAVGANHASRVFHVSDGANAEISGLSIVNGSASGLYGGGIYNDHSTLSVINCTLRDNSANAPNGAGGGIYNDASYGTATLWVSNCTLSGNSAVNGYGGGICNEGYNGSATLTVLNSTVSRNSAASGGGISSEGLLVGTATLDILDSTFSGNSATFGGGIYARSATSSSATVHVLYSTLSDNSATASSGGAGIYNDGAIAQLANTVFNASAIFNASGMIGSLGYNLSSDDGSGLLTATGDQINTDPMLGALQDNGGPTFTHEPLSGSPAVDAGDPGFDPYSFSSLLLEDQRGDGFPRVVNDRIDIGAFEVSPTPTPTATVTPTPPATATATPSARATAKTTRDTTSVSPALASMTLNPATVTGGANSTGTVTLSAAAPAGGAVVALKSSNTNAATVLPSVTVAAGATTATFTVTTKTVTVATISTITSTYAGISKAVGLVVNPLLGSLTLNPSVLIGGANSTSTGTVTLTSAAPAGGAVVTLTSSNPSAATVPGSVTVAAGATTKTFAVTTTKVTAPTQANITAKCVGASTIVTLTLNPALVGVSVNPAAVTGVAGSTGRVTLGQAAPAGGAVVILASNTPIAATVPGSVTVAPGAIIATFAVTTKKVTAVKAVTITATYSGVARTATLTVNPPAAGLVGVSVNPAAVTGPAGSTGTVTLGAAAPAGGAVVTLKSNNVNATVLGTVTVPANATTVTFAITTKTVTAVTPVTITATYNGVAKTATLTVNPPAAGLVGVSVNPAAVTGPAGSTGTVTLGAAAPAGGAVVTLKSNNVNATVLGTVTVPANATTVTFAITTKTVTAVTPVTITATYNGVAKTATLTVNPAGPAALAGVAMNPATMIFGSVSTGTVTLTAPAPAGGAVIALSIPSSELGLFYLPDSVTVPAGGTTAQFQVTTAIAKARTVITASYNGVNKTATLESVYPTVTALTCAPNPVIGGNPTVCTVTMNGIMVEDISVYVSSDQPLLLPGAHGYLPVPAGAVSAAFSFPTPLVPDRIVAHISASVVNYVTDTVTAPLTINLTNRGTKWNLNNVVFKDGGTASGYFVYDPAPPGQYLAVNIRVTQGTPPDPANPLGQDAQQFYYYPWPNADRPTFVNNGSTASLMSLQNPVTSGLGIPPSWTLLQFNFKQALTNAGGTTIPLVIGPNVPYTPHCANNPSPTCAPPPENISQELFALPDNPFGVPPVWYYRVIVSGSVTAQ